MCGSEPEVSTFGLQMKCELKVRTLGAITNKTINRGRVWRSGGRFFLKKTMVTLFPVSKLAVGERAAEEEEEASVVVPSPNFRDQQGIV